MRFLRDLIRDVRVIWRAGKPKPTISDRAFADIAALFPSGQPS